MTQNLLNPDAKADEDAVSKQTDQAFAHKQRMPEKFINPETGEIRTEALLKSYLALEKRMSQKAQGIFPSKPDEYNIACPHGLFDADADLNEKMFEKGFSEEQVQLVYDMAAEYMVPMILEMAAEFEADREVERLEAFFGGKEQWEQVSRQLIAYGQKNLPHTVLQGLASSFEGVKALYRMMQDEIPQLSINSDPMNMGSEKDVQGMVKDPRYWRDKDPEFISKVTQSFEQLYASE